MTEGETYMVNKGFELEPAIVGEVGTFHGWGFPGVKVPILKFDGPKPATYGDNKPWPLYIAVPEQFLTKVSGR